MAERAGAVFVYTYADLPLYDGVEAALQRGVRTGGDPRNREHVAAHVRLGEGVSAAQEAIGYDPQTSGGLLAAVHPDVVSELQVAGFVAIGHVLAGDARIELR